MPRDDDVAALVEQLRDALTETAEFLNHNGFSDIDEQTAIAAADAFLASQEGK